MEAPAITRHRRPFLAPIWLSALAAVTLAGFVFIAYRSASTTTILLIRHAERAQSSIDDPPLSEEGERRAERLGQMLGRVEGVGKVSNIYVSDTRRAQMTAGPLAERTGLKPVVIAARSFDAFARRALRENRGGVALIVGHSNTVPEIVEKLTGRDVPAIADDEFDNLYIVSVPSFGSASIARIKY